MRTARNTGTVLTLVIVAMSLMAVVLLILAGGARAMLFEANAAYCRAIERNLTASALAWSHHRAAKGSPIAAGDSTSLDTRLFGKGQTALAVQLTRLSDTTAEVRIETSCSKGRQTQAQLRKYTIPWPSEAASTPR